MRARRLPPLLIFDADGTLRFSVNEGQPYPTSESEWRLFPGVRARLSRLDWGEAGHRLGIASNQTGVALGRLSEAMARRLLRDMVAAALGFVPPRAAIEMCVCAPVRDCECRKPAPGMLKRILDHFALPPEQALFVGDLETDREAAARAGIAFAFAGDFFGRRR